MFENEKIKGDAITINVPAVKDWNITELRRCCKKNKVKGYTKMDKQQLANEVEKILARISEKKNKKARYQGRIIQEVRSEVLTMKYRGLAYDKATNTYHYVFGLPSYSFETTEISKIGTPYGDFLDINPATLGEETEYKDKNGRQMYTGDITTLEVDGEIRELEVVRTTIDREYNVLDGFEGETTKVRLSGVIAFKWHTDGKDYYLLPCVNEVGVADTVRMKIIDTVHERVIRESGRKGERRKAAVRPESYYIDRGCYPGAIINTNI